MQLKEYQRAALDRLVRYLQALSEEKARAVEAAKFKINHKWDEAAWEQLEPNERYQPRRNALGESVPAICLKVPTGGGKTLLAVKAIDLINTHYRGSQTGLVLWIVPTTQIYNQTLVALKDRAHPYRVQLNLASGDRTLILEKSAVFTPDDIRNHLVVLLLMLPSANRQVKETLRIFKDRGGFEPFFPVEDDYAGHAQLLHAISNLDTFAQEHGLAAATVKSSLGNTLRILKPVIVLDEGHKAYGELAQRTLLGFNPAFLLELSATPTAQSNRLVKIGGQELLREEMIKLDINVYNRSSADWRDTMLASHVQRVKLEEIAIDHEFNHRGPYIRPICLIQVERTGEKQRTADFIHAEEVRDFLIAKCGVPREEIAVKSSERDEIEQIDLLSRDCPIRYIITKQALQEGWDCAFAYILTVLTNPRKASASITQLVGRILRQPYARKTGRIELDESYVYCYRDTAGDLIRAVRAGLEEEGLGDLTGRVVPVGENGQRTEYPIRPQFAQYAGKVYLPCFVVRDPATGAWREVGYEMDVLSRIDWASIQLDHFETLELNLTRTENLAIAVGLGTFAEALRPTVATDMPLDLVFITRQISDLVPSPWQAYEFAAETVRRLRNRYTENEIRRDLAFVIEELKQQIRTQRIGLAKRVFQNLIQSNTLRFILISGCLHNTVPDKITATPSPPLTNEVGGLPLFSLFDYRADDFNGVERDVVLYLEQQSWVMAWERNFARKGYGLQGWHPQKIYPDFMVFGNGDAEPAAEFQVVYVLETKGLHLKGNDDTAYKQELFALCNELCQPRPWNELYQEMSRHRVRYKIIFEDEWKRVLNTMAAEPG
jgi:type III restriction enzyme